MNRRAFVAACVVAPWAVAENDGVIEPGREAEVLALLAPHQLGREITGGWELWHVRIGSREIEIELRSPTDGRARLRLMVPGEHAERSASFGITVEADAASVAAVREVVAAIKRNDHGGFWRARASVAPVAPPGRDYGMAWPAGVALVSIVAMLWAARAKRRA